MVAKGSVPRMCPMRTLIGLGPLAAAATAIGLSLLAACGGDVAPSNVTQEGTSASSTGASSSTGSTGTGSTGTGANASGGSLSLGGTQGVGGEGQGGIDGEACASATEQAELSPVYLVFLLDESGSMGDGKHGDRTKKWDPVTAALNAFFADKDSSGLIASLSLFPLNKNTTMGEADPKLAADCASKAYGKPEVEPRPLPDADAFKTAIDKLAPPNEYGTPTLPALVGTIDYAESLIKEDASRKVAIVMVTDGEPNGCEGNTVDATSKAAAKVADHLPTYVIGVGEKLEALNSIAKGGGTDKAFIINSDDPAQTPEKTQAELLAAVNLIRGKSISCELPVPAPPAGKKLDPNKVNVHFTPTGQADESLPYGEACGGKVAWHYDDAAHPTKILLCDDTCNTVKADATGKLGVEFACVDRVVVQ